MKKFRFKFEVLLRIKEEREKNAKEKYGMELQKKSILQIENESLKRDLISYENRYLQNKVKGDILTFDDIMLEDSYSKAINLRIAENNKKIEEIDNNLIKLKEELIEAMKERKIFEKLKEKKEAVYNKKMKKIVEKRVEILQYFILKIENFKEAL